MQFELFVPIHPLQEAAKRWRELAREASECARLAIECPLRSKWDHPASHQARARTYERTAQSLELEQKTGVWHCACCLAPRETRDQAELRASVETAERKRGGR